MAITTKDSILFSFVPASKVALPKSAAEAKLFIDSAGKIKVLYFNGDIKEISEAAPAQTVIETYDDSFLKQQIESLSKQLPSFVTASDLANEVALVLKTVDQEKNDVVAQIVALQAALTFLASNADVEAASKQLRSFVVEQVVAAESALQERIDKATQPVATLQEFISTLAESIQSLIKNVQSNNVVFESKLKLLEKVTKEEIAKVRSEIPTIISGSDTVVVSKENNVYTISVAGVDRIIERVTERVGGHGGGISRAKVQEMIDASLVGYQASGGVTSVNNISGAVEFVGTGSVTITTSGQQVFVDVGTMLASGNTILSGFVPLTDASTTYTVSHVQLDPALSVPVVAVESDSNFYKWRIYDRMTTSFKVALDAVPAVGENLCWHLTYSPFTQDFWVTEDPEDFVVDENDNRVELIA